MKKVFSLDNGVRVGIVPFQRAADIGLAVALDAGSGYEPAELNGVSHLLEHVISVHCRRFATVQERGEALDSLTSDFDALTDQRVMLFNFETQPKHFVRTVQLAADMLSRPRLTRPVVQSELRRIREEESIDNDNYETLLFDNCMAALNQGTGASQPICGSLANLRTLPMRQIDAWYRRMVVGKRMTVAVAGGVALGVAERAIRNTFHAFRPGQAALSQLIPARRQRLHVTRRQSRTVYVSLAFPVPFGFSHPDRFAMSVFKNHLYGRQSSRLFTQLVVQNGLVYAVDCAIRHTEEQGYLMVTWSVGRKRLMDTFDVVFAETDALADGKISADDLHRATAALKVTARMRNYEPMTQAKFYAEQLLLTGSVCSTRQYASNLSALRVRNIRRVARQAFNRENAHLTIVGPVTPAQEQAIRGFLSIP
jgi:predicted Zn-dependent peptidase